MEEIVPVRSGGMKTQVVAFCVALPLVMIGSCITADVAFEVYHTFPNEVMRESWWGPVLNRYAPGVGGLLVTMSLHALLRRTGEYTIALRAHLVRALAWYLMVGLIAGINYSNRGSSDFGLWSQVINWPLVGLLVGLGFDLLIIAFAPFIPSLRGVTSGGPGVVKAL
jgi:hypothetical protein